MKRNKVIIITIVVAAVLLIALLIGDYFWWHKLFKKPEPAPEKNTDTAGKAISWRDDSFPLSLGSSGNRVKQLQAGLNLTKQTNLALDGKFGEKTKAAVKEHFAVESISESAYNLYIKPNLEKINAYIQSSKTGTGSSATNRPGDSSFIGKSVFALKPTQGFMAVKNGSIWQIDESQPMDYKENQFIGVVEHDENGWLLCFRTNGSRVYAMKSASKIGY